MVRTSARQLRETDIGEGLELAKLAALPDAVTLKARLVTDRRSALEEKGAVRLEVVWQQQLTTTFCAIRQDVQSIERHRSETEDSP
jgi:hypothetical protein